MSEQREKRAEFFRQWKRDLIAREPFDTPIVIDEPHCPVCGQNRAPANPERVYGAPFICSSCHRPYKTQAEAVRHESKNWKKGKEEG